MISAVPRQRSVCCLASLSTAHRSCSTRQMAAFRGRPADSRPRSVRCVRWPVPRPRPARALVLRPAVRHSRPRQTTAAHPGLCRPFRPASPTSGPSHVRGRARCATPSAEIHRPLRCSVRLTVAPAGTSSRSPWATSPAGMWRARRRPLVSSSEPTALTRRAKHSGLSTVVAHGRRSRCRVGLHRSAASPAGARPIARRTARTA